jgi:hypothetical protein
MKKPERKQQRAVCLASVNQDPHEKKTRAEKDPRVLHSGNRARVNHARASAGGFMYMAKCEATVPSFKYKERGEGCKRSEEKYDRKKIPCERKC